MKHHLSIFHFYLQNHDGDWELQRGGSQKGRLFGCLRGPGIEEQDDRSLQSFLLVKDLLIGRKNKL